MIFSAALRAKARAALRQHWQTALLIALIVNLPTLLVQGISAFTNSDVTLRLENLLLQASGNTAAMNALPDSIRAMLAESGVIAMTFLGVLAWLVTPVLSIGMAHWTLERLRGQELPVSTVFSRLGIFFKSIGLRLFITLKVLLWMLPGFALTLVSMFLLFRMDSNTGMIITPAAGFILLLLYSGLIGMIVLGVMGYLYYAMAELILADEPEERVLSCARRSKVLMKGRRSRLMSLYMAFIPWYLLVLFGSSLIDGIAGPVIGLVAQMLGSLFLNAYILASEGAFYEVLRLAPAEDMHVGISPDDPQDPD